MDLTLNDSLTDYFVQADAVSLTVAAILVGMSVATWYLTLVKLWEYSRQRHIGNRFLTDFRQASDYHKTLSQQVTDSSLQRIARTAIQSSLHCTQHAPEKKTHFVLRSLQQAMEMECTHLEHGLTVLASIGSTAPFVGLFGMVWGIYHALIAIGGNGRVSIDKVAGPVGEALIMTGAGLAVAIPAVLAYNALTRINRLQLAKMDAFADELYLLLITGSRPVPSTDQEYLLKSALSQSPIMSEIS